jgi:DNA-binding GntR family transcriptional regulator
MPLYTGNSHNEKAVRAEESSARSGSYESRVPPRTPPMPRSRERRKPPAQVLTPLRDTLQLGARVYQALLDSIVNGQLLPGDALRPDAIASQLEVSTTPVREAMQRLEGDGLAVKLPYQGWFVREFAEQEIRSLYEFRAAMECFSVRLACERITNEELEWMHSHQLAGQAALDAGDIDAYRLYNRDLHLAIMRAARNSHLLSISGQMGLQTELLMARTIRISGRPLRAIEEHRQLIEFLEQRDSIAAQRLMEHHILSAMSDIFMKHPAEQGNDVPESDQQPCSKL